jgi:phosphatidate cytidylyltransferase
MACQSGELAKRVGVALVGIPVALAAMYLGGYWLIAFLAVLAGLAAWEFGRMHREVAAANVPALAALLAAGYLLLAGTLPAAELVTWAAIITLVGAASVMLMAPPETRPGHSVMVMTVGALLTGGLLVFAVWLRGIEGSEAGLRGAAILFLPVAVTWLGDTAAFFTGHAIGRNKLAPRISPGKTIEGAVGGLIATAGGALLYVGLTRPLVGWSLGTIQVLGLGVLVAVAGQTGDLFESRFKRECGVKDSSSLFPGHGGALDRLDSLLFVFPIAYAYLRIVGV